MVVHELELDAVEKQAVDGMIDFSFLGCKLLLVA
jgi:hypothetical protein